MLKARDLMEVISQAVSAEATVERALGIMRHRTLRDAPVLDRRGRVLGIVGQAELERARRDSRLQRKREQVLDWEILPAGGPEEVIRVGDLPCRKCIVAGSEESLGGLAHRMREHGVTLAVIRNTTGTIVGLLRIEAVLRGLERYERDRESR